MIHRPYILEARRLASTDPRRCRRWQSWSPYFAFATQGQADTRFEHLDDRLLGQLEFRKSYPPGQPPTKA